MPVRSSSPADLTDTIVTVADDQLPSLVVGAGPAGLAAAFVLARAGVPVVLVDDADRPGGKVRTVSDETRTFEHGVHGWWPSYVNFDRLLEWADITADRAMVSGNDIRVVVEDGKQLPLRPLRRYVPSPISIVIQALRTPLLTFKDMRRLVRFAVHLLAFDPARDFAAYEQIAFDDFLNYVGVTERARMVLFNTFTKTFCYSTIEGVNTAVVLSALRAYILPSDRGCVPRWLVGSSDEVLFNQMRRKLESLGVHLLQGVTAHELVKLDDRVEVVVTGLDAPPPGLRWYDEPSAVVGTVPRADVDAAPGGLSAVVGGVPLLLRRAGTTYEAIVRTCTHAGCETTWKESTFVCPCHGGVFDDAGIPTAGPPALPLARFTVAESGDQLTVARMAARRRIVVNNVILATDPYAARDILAATEETPFGVKHDLGHVTATSVLVIRFWFRDIATGDKPQGALTPLLPMVDAYFCLSGMIDDDLGLHVVEVQVAGAKEHYLDLPDANLVALALEDLRVVSRDYTVERLVDSRVQRHRDVFATFPVPEAPAIPSHPLPRIQVAGDWTERPGNSWMMERAVATGVARASHVLEHQDIPPVEVLSSSPRRADPAPCVTVRLLDPLTREEGFRRATPARHQAAHEPRPDRPRHQRLGRTCHRHPRPAPAARPGVRATAQGLAGGVAGHERLLLRPRRALGPGQPRQLAALPLRQAHLPASSDDLGRHRGRQRRDRTRDGVARARPVAGAVPDRVGDLRRPLHAAPLRRGAARGPPAPRHRLSLDGDRRDHGRRAVLPLRFGPGLRLAGALHRAELLLHHLHGHHPPRSRGRGLRRPRPRTLMPDWTYHPAWRPLVFRLPAEDARRLTVGYLSLQGRTKVGRELFRLLSYGIPNESTEVFGIDFPSRFGMGPGLDIDGRGLRVSQYLGCGFLSVGPVSVPGRPRVRRLDCSRIPEQHALVWSDEGYAPSVRTLAATLASHRSLVRLPVGVSVDDPRPALAIGELEQHADFFTVVDRADLDLAAVARSTRRPVLLRLGAHPDDEAVMARAEAARGHGFAGVVIGDHTPYDGLPGGRISGPRPVVEETLRLTRLLVERFGDDLPVVVTGAVLTPPDAADSLAAGASLVEITTGYVYSGPGIAARALKQIETLPVATPFAVEPVGSAVAGLISLWAFLAALVGIWVGLSPRRWLAAGDPVLLGGAVPQHGLALGISLVGVAAVAWIGATLARRVGTWVSWVVLAAVGVTWLISPVLAALGALMVLVGEVTSGWLRQGFRGLFDRSTPTWRWSAANLGRRSLQLGALLTAGAVFALEESLEVRVMAAAVAALGLLLLQRGLLPGVRPLWPLLVLWYGGCLALAGVALDGWLRWVVVAVAATLGAMGAGWLFTPLVRLDEGEDRFPDV